MGTVKENTTSRNNGGKKISNIIIESAVVPIVVNVANKVINRIALHNENVESKIKIPDLYSKEFPIDLEQAKILLNGCGLKYSESKMTINDSDKKYKDCFNLQVIASNPKQGTYVKEGTIVYLKYITQDVIDTSKRMYDEDKQRKAELKEQKEIEKQEWKENHKEKISNIVNKTKQTMTHMLTKQK